MHQVLRAPILVLSTGKRRFAMFPLKKILVATDFSDASDKALGEAIALARSSNAALYLLYVGDERTLHQCAFDFCLPDDMMQAIKERIVTSGEENLRTQLSKFPDASGLPVTTILKQGVPDEQILEEARARGVELIVIGAVGGTRSGKGRIGSIADNVTEDAPCSVLVVR
jgi:nucleotide-binding universal stress UspA family protein